MKNIIFVFIPFAFIISIIGCKKEGCTNPTAINYDEKANKDDGSCEFDTTSHIEFSFVSLTADNDSITAGSSTNITANATGNGLTYSWLSVNGEGDIIGSGNTVSFSTSPCMMGNYEIRCTVKDYSGNSETKSITIIVYL